MNYLLYGVLFVSLCFLESPPLIGIASAEQLKVSFNAYAVDQNNVSKDIVPIRLENSGPYKREEPENPEKLKPDQYIFLKGDLSEKKTIEGNDKRESSVSLSNAGSDRKTENKSATQKSGYFSGSQAVLKGSHYIFDPIFPIQLKNYFSLYGNLNLKWEKDSLLFQTNGITEIFFDGSRQIYYTIPEMYLSYHYGFEKSRFADSLKVYVGRYIKEWSWADTYWEFGDWNPLNLWEPLYPSENGLIGAFLDIAGKYWLFEFYVGGIHLPHVGPKLQVNQPDGGVKSSSRWAELPPEAVNLPGLKLDIDYLVNFLIEKLLQDSYGLSWKVWTAEDKNIWVKGSFGYKPTNRVILTQNKGNSLKIKPEKKNILQLDKNIENYIVKQRILSIEGGMRFGGVSTLFSAFQSKKKIPKSLPKEREFVKKPSDHVYLSGLAGYEVSLWKDMKTKVQMGYIHPLGKKVSFPGNLINHKLLQGVSFDWIVKTLNVKGLKREISFRYWHSLERWKSFFSLNVLFHLLPEWYIGGQINIVAGKEGDKSFFGEFRNNDYISWRTGYVF